MLKLIHGSSKKRTPPMSIVGIINMQQRMLGVIFEGYIVSMHGFYNVTDNGIKYIHYDLIDVLGILQHKKKSYFCPLPKFTKFLVK
jgi:hypothetical protein